MRITLGLGVLLAAALALAESASASPAAILGATYAAAPPASAAAGATLTVPVTLTNTGNEAWTAGGPNPVNLTYHWYDERGAILVWEGVRTPLGADVAPGASRQVTANVLVPSRGGLYQLRFHLVKEGVAWFPQQSGVFAVQVQSPYAVRFGTVPIHTYLATATYTVQVPITNIGTATWNAAGTNPVSVSYHWHTLAGDTIVWDGVRTPLPQDVAPGATVTVPVRVVAPDPLGPVRLTFDLVREGVNWFQFLGGTPVRIDTAVEAARYSARYDIAASTPAYIGETKAVPVTITNTGNVTWNAAGANPVNLAFHVFDSAGGTVVWDGTRTPLGTDLAPGQSRTLSLAFTAPTAIGTYSLNVDAVREGLSWFSGYGVPAGSTRLSVTSGYSAGYGATTTPPQAGIGALVDVTVEVTNYGPRTLVAGGPNPVRLSYHVHTAAGAVVVWDGARGILPRDLPAGTSATVPISVQLPSATGDYRVSWDLVQEGVAWLSQYGVTMKVEPVSVIPGVTFYGKGFGHGVGMSQYGAQGLATGAGGAALTGEQIIQYYYRGTQITPIPTQDGNTGIRVLLSVPSSTGIYTCGSPAMNTSLVDLSAYGIARIVNEGAANAPIGSIGPNENYQIAARNGVVQVWKNVGTPTKVYEGPGPVTVVADPSGSLRIQQKGTYRGNTRFVNSGGVLRVVNFVNYDDYAKGVIRKEMLANWHFEAYKAQAYAAKAYAYTSYRGGASDYDVRDDQLDQCYGGVGAEEPLSNSAVDATRGRIPTYNGAVIRAYFSASSGGYTVAEGCWGARLRFVSGRYTCGDSQPYLVAVQDPADLRVSTPAPNRHASWQVTFTSAQIRNAILNMRGVDMGTLISVDVSNQAPAGGHVVSVLVRGTNGVFDLQADVFLRTHLSLKSTYVRLSPF
ncbi:MAG TPA: SpoIID/LytB domain-containing protein [Candidatus Limnocylindria bacterium]|nr:SpoIID/LytB domain-containing protein [Candidatus Limnocylindria bacterium]